MLERHLMMYLLIFKGLRELSLLKCLTRHLQFEFKVAIYVIWVCFSFQVEVNGNQETIMQQDT